MVMSGIYPVSRPKEMFFWILILALTALFGILTLSIFTIELILLVGSGICGLWGWMLESMDDYKKVRRKVSKIQYVKPRSFKFTEYKNK